MRTLANIVTVLGLLLVAYSFVGSSAVWSHYSDIAASLAELQRREMPVPKDIADRLTSVTRLERYWHGVAGFGGVMFVLGIAAIIVDRRKHAHTTAS